MAATPRVRAVYDGFKVVDDPVRGVRAMFFDECPDVEQCCVKLKPTGEPAASAKGRTSECPDDCIDRDEPFEAEVNQAFVMCFGAIRELGWDPGTAAAAVCVIGGGCGVWPMAIAAAVDEMATIDVVELSPDVIEAGKQWFGMHDDPGLRVHQGDGLEYLATVMSSAYDIVIIDVCAAVRPSASGAGPGDSVLVLPPRPFVDAEWLRAVAAKTLHRTRGLLAVNVVGSRDALAEVATSFASAFVSCAMLGTADDNVVFFGFTSPTAPNGASVYRAMESATGRGELLRSLAPELLERLDPEQQATGNLVGWMSPTRFCELLKTAPHVWSGE